MRRRIVAAGGVVPVVVLCLTAGPASAGPAQDGPAASRAGSARTALAELPARGPVDVVTVTDGPDGAPEVVVEHARTPQIAEGLIEDARSRSDVRAVELAERVQALHHPAGDDPMRDRQWGMTALRAEHLWSSAVGEGAVVALVDSGVDGAHPDLQGALVGGRDYVDPAGDGLSDPAGHGTHLAGTIVARPGNGQGVVGLAPAARVLSMRVLDEYGGGYDWAVAQAVIDSVEAGADVVNLSLGSVSPSLAMEEAVSHALDSGVVVVAAMGNDRSLGSPVSYPAALPGVIAVAATTPEGRSADFSSEGAHVAVSAPGQNILSTGTGGRYHHDSGTSMAAPHVAAVVAAMLSAAPGLTPAQTQQVLTATADDLEAPGFDTSTGAGLVDPSAALASLGVAASTTGYPDEPPPPPATSGQVLRGLPRDWDGDGSADVLAADDTGRLYLYRGASTGAFRPGRQQVGHGWNARDLLTLAGDWDGDSRPDLIARGPSDGRLWLYPGNGAGGFLPARQIGHGWNGMDMILSPSDWTGDGAADLLARRSADGAVVLYPGNGRGGFLPSRQVGWGWQDMDLLSVAGDWDGDGNPDVVASDDGGRLHLYSGDGRGGFSGRRHIGVGWGVVDGLVGPGDWDGDGRTDLLAVMSDGSMRLYPGNGRGGFRPSRQVGAGWSHYRPAA